MPESALLIALKGEIPDNLGRPTEEK